jgi:hypothetical protein
MSHDLDTGDIETQLHSAVTQAIAALNMPVCDEACEANAALSGLQTKMERTQASAKSAQDDASNAREKYFVTLRGGKAFNMEKNARLKEEASKTAHNAVEGVQRALDAVQAPLGAAVALERLADSTSLSGSAFQSIADERERAVDKQQSKVLLDKRRAAQAATTRAQIMAGINGWMRYAYFAVTALFLISFVVMGGWATLGNILRLGVVLLLPFTVTTASRWAQEYSPFGQVLTSRLRYLYDNGLQGQA